MEMHACFEMDLRYRSCNSLTCDKEGFIGFGAPLKEFLLNRTENSENIG